MRFHHCLFLTILCAVVIVSAAGCTASNSSGMGSGNSPSNYSDNSSGNIQHPAELVWQNTLSKSRFYGLKAMIRTNDGGYAITGITSMRFQGGRNLANFVDRMVLVKTDPEGNELWNNTYGYSYSYGTALVQASDNGYVIVGSNNNTAYMVKTDPEGREAWNESFNWAVGAGDNSIIKTSDGGYAITGCTGNDISGPRVVLARLDPNGSVLWQNTYDNGCGLGVIQTADGGYVISVNAKIHDANSSIDTFQPQLIKTDARGNANGVNVYRPGSDDYNSSFITMTRQAVDGGYVICGSTSPSNIFLIRTDSNCNELWTKTYGPFGDSYEDYPHESYLAPSNDGGYIVIRCEDIPRVFTTIPPNPSEWVCAHVYLFKVDKNGNEIWNNSTTYRGDGNYYCISINNYDAEGGNLLGVLGYDSSTFGDDFYVVKVA